MPVSAGSSPVIIFNRVDLPAPLIPTMAAFSWSFYIKRTRLNNNVRSERFTNVIAR